MKEWIIVGLVLIAILISAAQAYVVWHFITKFW